MTGKNINNPGDIHKFIIAFLFLKW